MTETIREYADVVFPAEAYAEKEGTLTHPDGRLQRLRTAIGRPQPAGPGTGVRPGWQVIADVAERAGHAARRRRRADRLAAAVRGRPVLRRADARRDRRPAACAGRSARRRASFEVPAWEPVKLKAPRAAARRQGRAAARHLPLAVELQGGRRLAGAALPAPAAGRRALARRRQAARDRRRRPRRGRLQRHARARRRAPARRDPARLGLPRRRHARGRRQPAHRGAVEIARVGGPETGASAVAAQLEPGGGPRRDAARRRRWRSRRPARASRGTTHDPARRGRLLRGVVDPAAQGGG